MRTEFNRRQLFGHSVVSWAGVGAVLGSAEWVRGAPAPAERSAAEPFGYCLNTSTLRGHKLPLPEIVELAAKVGYRALEPWLTEMRAFQEAGGKPAELRKRLDDLGMSIESVIGFAEWIVDDDQKRAQGMEQAKRDLDLVAQFGGRRLAAPPTGATKQKDLDLRRAAERYRQLLELGDQFGVVAELELWGFSEALSRLGEVLFVAAESGHPQACVLLDVYHLYKGGNDIQSLRLLNGRVMHVIHMNDYPANPPRAEITDAQRVYPGDGVAPLATILRTLRDNGFGGHLSLELFNRDYWSQDPLQVARTGLEKMRVAVVGAKLQEPG